MAKPPSTCINCGSPLSGNFCSNCGEKVFSDHDKTIGHFVHETFHFLTHLDGKFLTSLKAVFSKPGLLSLEYCRGIRKKYFKPVSLFLVGVIIYLFFPLLQGLNMSYYENINTFSALHIYVVEDVAVKKAEKKNITTEELANRYDAKSPKVSKIMLLLLLPFSGLLLWLLFFRKREYLFDHLIMGTEINTVFLYMVFLFIPLLLLSGGKIWYLISGNDFHYGDPVIVPLQIVILSAYWSMSFRKFYGTGVWETIWKTFVFFVLHGLLVYVVYRLLLFLVVMMFI
ncbi:MAG: DUF3667 domain-containing protein [Cyclobacteriaceae bacterium]|nr:DUF3667 domain-containing protein [Cyclobacteriaceae bacterium]